MRYLFIGAHVDDVPLSCGGYIAKLKDAGNHVKVVSLSYLYNGIDLRDEWIESMKILNVDEYSIHDFPVRNFSSQRQQILDYIRTLPDVDFVITHSATDRHQDHCVVGAESLRAFPFMNIATYMGEWNGNLDKNFYVALNNDHVHKKVEALQSYSSQKDRTYMSGHFIWSDAVVNGVKCGSRYAEAFNIVNCVE